MLVEAADRRVQPADLEPVAGERAEVGDQPALRRAAHDAQALALRELLVGTVADVRSAERPAQPSVPTNPAIGPPAGRRGTC
jgi:hypothetical protein